MVISKGLLYELAYENYIGYFDVVILFRKVVEELKLDSLYSYVWKINDDGNYEIQKRKEKSFGFETITREKFTEEEETIFNKIEKKLRDKLNEYKKNLPKSAFLSDILNDIDAAIKLDLLNDLQILVKTLAEPVYFDFCLNDYILPLEIPTSRNEVGSNQLKINRVRLSSIISYEVIQRKRDHY